MPLQRRTFKNYPAKSWQNRPPLSGDHFERDALRFINRLITSESKYMKLWGAPLRDKNRAARRAVAVSKRLRQRLRSHDFARRNNSRILDNRFPHRREIFATNRGQSAPRFEGPQKTRSPADWRACVENNISWRLGKPDLSKLNRLVARNYCLSKTGFNREQCY